MDEQNGQLAKRPRGRPSIATPEIKAEICARLANGEPLTKICRDPECPGTRTIYEWMQADKEFSAQVARARELGFDSIAVDALEIADNGTLDTYLDADGNQRCDNDVVQRSKLRVETRLKLLACWCPARYGQRVDVAHSGDVKLTIRVGGKALPESGEPKQLNDGT